MLDKEIGEGPMQGFYKDPDDPTEIIVAALIMAAIVCFVIFL